MRFRFSRVEIERKYLYRLLNNSELIEIRDVLPEDETVKFIIDEIYAEDLKRMLKELNIPIISWQNKGVYTLITKFPVIKATVAILMIFMLLMLINSLFIWKISVDGNYSYTQNQIVSFLNTDKIRSGMIKASVNSDEIEREIRNKFKDISWVCAEVKGTNLLIHIKENYITEISKIEDKPYNIVANRDGQIKSIIVRKGTPMVKVGDNIKKGTILVSGGVDVVDESGEKIFSKFYPADGDIVAQSSENYKERIKIDYEKKVTTKTKNYYLPAMFNYKWSFSKKENRDVIMQESAIKFFGNYYTPLSIQKITTNKYKKVKGRYTKKQAEDILLNKMYYKLTIMEQKGYKIIKKNVRMYKDNDSYEISGKITYLSRMGSVSYIDQNQLEEGTTRSNERN